MSEVVIRALTSADIENTVKWNNDSEIKNNYAGHPFLVNLEMEKDWYDKVLHSNIPTTVFGIELKEKKKLIGISLLKNINLIHRNAEFAILIGDKKEKGKGYARIAALETISFGFNQLGLHRIYLSVQLNNEIALGLYKKLGFKVEGELRETIFKNGEYLNECLMGILQKDFKAQHGF